jgi:hypothetical protein
MRRVLPKTGWDSILAIGNESWPSQEIQYLRREAVRDEDAAPRLVRIGSLVGRPISVSNVEAMMTT